jgi:hypothetical protein
MPGWPPRPARMLNQISWLKEITTFLSDRIML